MNVGLFWECWFVPIPGCDLWQGYSDSAGNSCSSSCSASAPWVCVCSFCSFLPLFPWAAPWLCGSAWAQTSSPSLQRKVCREDLGWAKVYGAEQQIKPRGHAVEVQGSSDKCQESAAGNTIPNKHWGLHYTLLEFLYFASAPKPISGDQ